MKTTYRKLVTTSNPIQIQEVIVPKRTIKTLSNIDVQLKCSSQIEQLLSEVEDYNYKLVDINNEAVQHYDQISSNIFETEESYSKKLSDNNTKLQAYLKQINELIEVVN